MFVEHRRQRITVTAFASHIHRIQQIADAAVGEGRLVVPLGRTMMNNIRLARNMGLLSISEQDLGEQEAIEDCRPDEICIIATGSQGE